jgi:hypothetical protein
MRSAATAVSGLLHSAIPPVARSTATSHTLSARRRVHAVGADQVAGGVGAGHLEPQRRGVEPPGEPEVVQSAEE